MFGFLIQRGYLRAFLESVGDIRRSMRQPLTFCPDDSFDGASFVINAASDAVRVAKIKLCQVAMKVLVRAVLINAFHASFED